MVTVFSIVERKELEELEAKLKDVNDPETNNVTGCLNRLRRGQISGNIFTDQWPNVSAVVCQITKPRYIGDKVFLVYCFASSDSALVDVLKGAGLVQPGMKFGVAKHHSDAILKEFPSLKVTFEGTRYYLPGPLRENNTLKLCSSEFFLAKLSPSQEHAEFLASHWKYMKDGVEKTTFFKDLIETGHSCGVFKTTDRSTPVAWALQYTFGTIGHVFTLPEYRHRGLASVVVSELCKLITADGLTPTLTVEVGNPVCGLFVNLGFVPSGYQYNYIDFQN